MLDSAIIDQLKTVFEKLEAKIELSYTESDHAKQSELIEMLEGVASTSENIVSSVSSGSKADFPHFKILKDSQDTGISFSGIPGGHEFSSLILAILNSDLKGKLPDEMILNRIRALGSGDSKIELRTYIALSCETCPEVVQALNLMSVLNPRISHEMRDGEFFQDDIEKLKIQGVPSVFKGNEMLSSGRNDLMGLLEKFEEAFGKSESPETAGNKDLGEYDVVVVGGGPAGASAAIYTARKGLKTAIITDRMGGQLQDTKGIENMISVPYTEGPELSASLAKHIAEYDIQMLEHRRVESVDASEVKKKADFKKLSLNSGEKLKTKAFVVASGAKWRELNVDGEKEYMGRGVAYCPHCDGPYYKGKDVAVVGGGNSGVEAAIDLAGIVKSVTLFEFMDELKADKVLVDKLESLPNTKIIKSARTHKVVGDGEKVTAIEYEDRTSGELKQEQLDGIFVQIGLLPNSAFVKETVKVNDYGEIVVDDKCRTNVPGIYAAGDVTTVPYKQIIIALGEGAKAGLSAFEDLAF
jgi:alkyl hydroperoxide reductase subunit F